MADNYTIKDGSGSTRTIAAHDVGTGLVPQSIPTGLNGLPLFTSANPGFVSMQGTITISDGTGPLTVDGSVSVANFPATQAVTATQTGSWTVSLSNGTTVTANLGTLNGAATSALQTAGNTSLSSLDGKTPSLGQATKAASAPVVIASDQGAIATREQPGITPVQTYVPVSAFASGNVAGAGGTNGTVSLAVTTTNSTAFLSIDNTGSADAEVWFGAIPADANVGQSPKRGKLLPAGAGLFFDVRVPVGPIYVTASAATGLSVVTG